MARMATAREPASKSASSDLRLGLSPRFPSKRRNGTNDKKRTIEAADHLAARLIHRCWSDGLGSIMQPWQAAGFGSLPLNSFRGGLVPPNSFLMTVFLEISRLERTPRFSFLGFGIAIWAACAR